jgi:hypothetical protein
MPYEFQWNAGEAENGNYESFESFDAPPYQPQQRRSGGRFGGVSGEQEGVYGEQESLYEGEGGFGDYEGEYGDSEGEGEGEAADEAESVFDEMDEMDLAAELLSLSDEQELDQFIGKIIRSAGKAVGSVISGPVGQALGSLLKAAARQSLPMFRGHRGGGNGGRVFGLEVEGLSGEDQDFEFARRYVRLGGAATGRAARSHRRVSPQVAARRSLMAAARRFAPGLLRRLYRGRHRSRDYRRPYGPGAGVPGYPPPGYPYPQPMQYPPPGTPDQQGGAMAPAPGPVTGPGAQGPASPDFSGAGGQDPGGDGGVQGPGPQSGQWSRQGRQLIIHL